jgi:hypothetical protein
MSRTASRCELRRLGSAREVLETRRRLRYNVAMRVGSTESLRLLPRHLLLVLLGVAVSVGLSFARPVPHPAAAQNSGADKSASSDKKDEPPPTTRLKISIADPNGRPVGQASVYIRFNESGGLFHKDKLAEMDLKTNDDGTVKVPSIPQGKIMIQVIAKGWRTYGRWYYIEKAEETVEIKLQSPPHWY